MMPRVHALDKRLCKSHARQGEYRISYAGHVHQLSFIALGLTLLLSGCGSGHPPPFTLTCTLHPASPTGVLAHATIANQTIAPAAAYVYGPALATLQHIAPVPRSAQVVVITPHGRTLYLGYAIPHIGPKHPAHLTLRLTPGTHQAPILVSPTRTIHVASLSDLDNPDCEIKRL